MDYMKRMKKELGVKTALKSTPLMECSSFVRSANERHDDVFQNAVRKVEETIFFVVAARHFFFLMIDEDENSYVAITLHLRDILHESRC
jgi:hypothetical protein